MIHHEVHEGNEEKDKKMKNRQQLNYLQHQYIYCIYCKLLCLKYLQNLSSVISILSSEPYTYDNAQQKLTETITYGTEIFNSTYSYHPDGQKASYTGIDATTYSFYYNNLGILQNIVIPNEGNISSQNFQWNRPQTINYPGGITRTLAYDGLQRINSINVQDTSNQTLMNYDYTYTPTGNITNKNTEHGNYIYGYDNLDRLTTADYPTLTDETFTYDALGNRKTDSNTGITQWLYNQNNQLLNSVNNQFTYDANGSQIEETDASGQLLKQYIYNTENRLAEIKDENNQTIATYYYDPLGRRLSKTITNPDTSTTTTYFHYNDEGYSAEKTNGQIISYLFSPQNTWSTSPILKRENNTYYYYQNDHLGTPNILHDKQGLVVNAREMKAFGEWENSTDIINSNFAFAGQYKDFEKKALYNYFRDYRADIGRYIISDPINLNDGMNIYMYSNSNPILYIDELGLCYGFPNLSNTPCPIPPWPLCLLTGGCPHNYVPDTTRMESFASGVYSCIKCNVKCLWDFAGGDILEAAAEKAVEKAMAKRASELAKQLTKYTWRVIGKVSVVFKVRDAIKFVKCEAKCF
ncbi:hypothetical protein MNBD_GAMMA01-195 [hydrothermal vent metagenome]|uniref:Teneurin-like YD-shell domain-containing protein n=1 Tax=hydrothermal vent metagenome TaxID=652676 RepID=A0A3B0V094_9ZZZZ